MSTKQIYSFGPYNFTLCCKESELSLIPNTWKKYRSSFDGSHFTIRASLENPLESHSNKDGWTSESTGNEHYVTFAENSKSLFSISYSDSSAVYKVIAVQRKNLLTGMQFALMLALRDKCIGLHCSTVICGGKAVLLSAPSGTGKTTISDLLSKYCETVTINGDFALLSPHKTYGLLFHPTPFCGTSGQCHNQTLPIDRIIFLAQGTENIFIDLNTRQALMHLMSNTFIPPWDSKMQAQIKSTIMDIADRIPVSLYSFQPTRAAAELLYSIVNK